MKLKFWKKNKPAEDWVKADSQLYAYAVEELTQAGWLEDDGMYGDMIGTAVLDLVEVFARQGHSGMSAGITLRIFNELASWRPINPLTFGPEQWNEVGNGTHQHRRKSTIFSEDGLMTWYDLDEEGRPRHPIGAEA